MSLRSLRSAVAEWHPAARPPGDRFSALAAAWASIVGPQVAAHCAPVQLSGEVLVVATRSSSWSQQLQFLSTTILERIRDLGMPDVTCLRFRSGRFRGTLGSGGRVPPPAPSATQRVSQPAPPPAADVWDAVERVRRRVNRLQHGRRLRCASCGLGLLSGAAGAVCAPCTEAATTARRLTTQRALYAMPWLDYAGLCEHVPQLRPAEYEQARRYLLARWWQVLERARRAGRLSRDAGERQIAGSYVLLKSRLPPDRLTDAVVGNLLGADLAALVWGSPPVSTK